jgi:hypothetical protein
MGTGISRRAATTAAALTTAGTLGFALLAPAAYGAAQGPCYDGRCSITVSKPQAIKVDAKRFRFGNLYVTNISARSVRFSARTTSGAYLSGSSSPGGSVRLNNLNIVVKSATSKKAALTLSPS